MRRIVIFLTLIFILIIGTYLIITGSQILVKPIIKGYGLPYGTIVTWLVISSLPLSIYFGIEKIQNPNTNILIRFSLVLKIIIVLCLLWGIISYLLSGNWAYVFSQKSGFRGSAEAAAYFWRYTMFVVLIPHIYLLAYGLHILFTTIRKKM